MENNIKKNLAELRLGIFKEFLFKFSLLLKNARLVGSIGSLSSVEEIYFFYQFLKYSGSSNLLINNFLYSYNIDLPLFYHFNSSLHCVENSDLIVLVGVNPRLEGSMLNMRIRKQFFNTDILVGYFGSFNSFTYPVSHLGTSTKHFINFVEGKHSFCKKLRNSKKPLIILGSEIGLRIDSKVLQNLNRFLSLKIYLHLKNFLGLNILHQNLSQIHLCDLGLNPTAKSFVFLSLLNKNFSKKFLKVYF